MSEAVWLAVIAAVSGLMSLAGAALVAWIKSSSEAKQRIADAAVARQERLDREAREDAREARAAEKLETIKKNTDGVIAQVAALAKSTGKLEGSVEATKVAEDTAATLLLGRKQGRDEERESLATKVKQDSDAPVSVKDSEVGASSKRIAEATEVVANETKRVADAAELKKEK